MSVTEVAIAAAALALDKIERELADHDARKQAADETAMLLRQKLLLRTHAEAEFERRKQRGG